MGEIVPYFSLCYFYMFVGHGMYKSESGCMQALAVKLGFVILGTIERVACHGMTYACHMHSDLMGTSGF